MTIEELYKYAVKHDIEDYDIWFNFLSEVIVLMKLPILLKTKILVNLLVTLHRSVLGTDRVFKTLALYFREWMGTKEKSRFTLLD